MEQQLEYLARWAHYLFGIVWIGLLYYFNFVQTEYFKEAEADHRAGAIQKLVPRALWWFRWGAAFTFLTGLVLLFLIHKNMSAAGFSFDILVGATLGTLMAINVWMVIWPNQKIVIASAQQVAAGGEALSEAAIAAPKAALASRTNTLFSIPMLFFMGSSAHATTNMVTGASIESLIAVLVLILALEINALRGSQGPMTSVKGVIHCGLGLTLVLWGLMKFL